MSLSDHEDFHGELLKAVLSSGLRLELRLCLRIVCGLTCALEGMHAARIIHRDIRPATILVDRETGETRLVEAGIAVSATHDTEGRVPPIGDWAYVSPEQTGRMNRPVDYRTDFYSLGVTLYQMLTGQLPFQGTDPVEWMHCHIARSPVPPHDMAPDIPAAVSAIVMKLLAKLPEDRYESAHGLQADIEHCLAQWQERGRIDPFPLGMNDVSDRFQIPHRLYGREQEMAALLAAFERMAATGEPTLATVSGYSGVGKSSLVHELLRPIVHKRGYFITGKFDQIMRDTPYATLTQAFSGLVQQLLAESEARIAEWRRQILDSVGLNGQLIVDVLPQIELIIGRQPPLVALPPVEAQNRFQLVFQRFMGVFCVKKHPLVLFLDDVQWADAASLRFIEHLFIHSDTRHLLLIAAYRDNEVSTAHPLTATLEAIRNSNVTFTDIRLASPSVTHLNWLVADTLHAPLAACSALTHLVFERTGGNPFFFVQFLDALYKEGLLRHDSKEHVWRWHFAQIKSRNFADNVADLMARKLAQLPENVQEPLQLAACLGARCDLHPLTLISGLTEHEMRQRLSAAARENLVLIANGHCKFLHDRIRQAAYALIPEACRAEVHLRIGRTLLAHMTEREIDSHLFDIANQFTQGAALLDDADEKARVAQISLRAGRKAKASAAYASACVYLAAGMGLFGNEDWSSRHALMFDLWLERAECEFLNGRFDTAGQLIAILLERAASKIDLAAAYRQKVQLHLIVSEYAQAVDAALACLRVLGIDLPAHPAREQVQAEYDLIWRNLGARTIESLVDQPLAIDPEIQAGMDMLGLVIPAVVVIDDHLAHLLIYRLMNLSLQHGATSASAFGYGMVGLILCSSFHRYAEGYRWGRLACDLVEKHSFVAGKPLIYHGMAINMIWTQPLAAAIEMMRTANHMSIETGNFFLAGAGGLGYIAMCLLQATPLDEVDRELERLLDFARKVKGGAGIGIPLIQQRFVAAMQGRTKNLSTFDDPRTDAGALDETAFEAKLVKGGIAHLLVSHRLLKMQACFLAGDHADALAAMHAIEGMLWGMLHMPHLLVEYRCYAALTMAALCDTSPGAKRDAWRDTLAAHREQLREWADINPSTFGARYMLVSAEVARLEGHDADAMRLYDEAVQSSRQNGFLQYEGIAHETAACFYLARGAAIAARTHLVEARSCFARWGASAKVRQLDERYTQLRLQPPSAGSPEAGVTQLDALSIARASQAISGRIVLDELIDTLMRIVLENAGAQSGALLLMRGGEQVLAAEASVAQQAIQVRVRLAEALPEPDLPAAILNYVRRTQTQVLLADAAEPHPFAADPYLAHHGPKSVLCIPIVRQTTLVGLLYLENTLIPHAFTPERVTVLELLASQAAISLENALLYTDLKQENSERKRVEAVLLERESRIRRLVDSNIIGILFWNIQGGISDANEAFLRLLGYSRDDLVSGKLRWTELTPAAYHEADARAMQEIRLSGTIAPYEKAFIHKDGTCIPVLVGSTLFEQSRECGVAFVLDLSERKQAEAEREARHAAEAANQAKSAFLANMGHELRTPLNGILGYAQLLEQDPALDQQQLEEVNVIHTCGEHLLDLINDLLDLAKIEAGKMELYPVDIPLSRFVRTITDIVGVKAQQKGLELVCDLASDLPPTIRADEKRLRQVLLNLLSNAVKFTDDGRITLRMRFALPAQLCCEVQDTGTGIAPDQLGTIFEPFEQVGNVRRRLAGTGLGLTISRQYVQLMGGDIQVESQPGQGTTFRFEVKVEAQPL